MNRQMALALGIKLCFLNGGCGLSCSQQTCDCFSEGEDDIFLRFDLDSLNQCFRRIELRNVFVVRYSVPGFVTALDTVRDTSAKSEFLNFYASRGVRLNYLFERRPGNNQDFTGYNYAVVLPRAGRRYLVSELELAGETRGSRCCSCYRNTRKRLRLDGAYLIAENSSNNPAAVLRR
jgi:hypothetical protein